MIRKKACPALGYGVGAGFPLANKRGTRLRGDHAQTKSEKRDDDCKKSHPALAFNCDCAGYRRTVRGARLWDFPARPMPRWLGSISISRVSANTSPACDADLDKLRLWSREAVRCPTDLAMRQLFLKHLREA